MEMLIAKSKKTRRTGQTRKIPFHLHYYGNETEKPENVGLLSQRDCPPGPFIDYVGVDGVYAVHNISANPP